MDELRKTQIMLTDMLKAFHDFCVTHSFTYYGAYGTALGTARHQGFIPWDDDVDVIMPRPDYEKFIVCFLKENKRRDLILETPFYPMDEEYIYPYAKIFNTQTTLIENNRHKTKRGIFIDIFPLDGAGQSMQENKELWKIIGKMRIERHYASWDGTTKMYRGVRAKLFRLIKPKWYTGLYISRKMNEMVMEKDYNSSVIVCNYFGGYGENEKMNKNIMGKPQLAKYEDISIYIPEHIDDYLSRLYGNWRELPEESKRITHHNFVVDLEHSFLE